MFGNKVTFNTVVTKGVSMPPTPRKLDESTNLQQHQ